MRVYQTRLYPTDLTEAQWEVLQPLLPPANTTGRPRKWNSRLILNTIVYVVVGGIQWRLLPREYPPWQSVYSYCRHWREEGTWQRLHDTLRAQARRRVGRHKHPTAGCLDSQSIKASAGVGERGYDAGKQVNGRKRHLLVDTLGWVLAVVVTAASVQDREGARRLLSHLGGAGKKLRLIWVDGNYRGPLIPWVTERFRFFLRPVLRADDQKGFVVLPRRWVVERTFGWLVANRRLSKDYEGLPASSEAMIYIAMTRLMLRRLAA
ncbi:MAG TPA: IS5 family transposase [Candidatus Competibacteraceae bacterium]|nr:IS5 family transposase [Candidatus Competibacteraceae bacterium]